MQTIQLYFMILRDSLKSFHKLFIIHRLTLQSVREEGEDIKTFVFKSNKKLNYKAGQYGIWMLKKWVNGKPARLFTIASPPEEDVIQLSTRIGKRDFKQKLSKLVPGDSVLLLGPIGEFTLPKHPSGDIVFVAGGIGITPVRAIAKYISDTSLPVKTTLIHSGHDYFLYKDELEKCINQTYFTDRDNFVTVLTEVAEQQQDATFYISGPPQFVSSARKSLIRAGIYYIKTDGFLGY